MIAIIFMKGNIFIELSIKENILICRKNIIFLNNSLFNHNITGSLKKN